MTVGTRNEQAPKVIDCGMNVGGRGYTLTEIVCFTFQLLGSRQKGNTRKP